MGLLDSLFKLINGVVGDSKKIKIKMGLLDGLFKLINGVI